MNKNDKEFMVQKIRAEYAEKEHTELDALKELDTKVKRPANIFACAYGTVSALVIAAGMSLVMTDIGEILHMSHALSMVLGIIIGIMGLAPVCCAYPIYTRTLKKRTGAHRPRNFEAHRRAAEMIPYRKRDCRQMRQSLFCMLMMIAFIKIKAPQP